VLVDAGDPGTLPAIQREMELAGVPFERLTKLILTHQDIDHIGGAADILSASKHHIEVLAHEKDKPYIEGDKPLIKFDHSQGPPPRVKVDRVISDGEVLPFLRGLTVIFTPGHTPGHISLYHSNSKTLITADATIAPEGKLIGPNEIFTPDMDLAWKSFARFTDFDVRTALVYHGGICNSNVNEQISLLVNRFNH
jgi:glyoxylase-like metal-dependent hydrolase (beta-lactamase superfamily II)